ncbi:putative L,D-transpeptidase LppS [Streptomyces sp. RB5]|uniref:Putative L,D-transpeptidase LppS n=1 Tax=Streptomyces smaragdinus TaxID=2585196 RepID=A0A7K0CAP6_9ACTN|nr:Ig-like domain-containing protein [Streptomyces smaragdinus]MQY10488.1 putative L,D-transpeptidase LppS [Streptomyces smaragdinus]
MMYGKRRRVAGAAVAAVAALLLAGCTGTGKADTESGSGGGDKKSEPFAMTLAPAAGKKDVPVAKKVTVGVRGGKLVSVEVASPGPGKLAGKLNGQRTSWTSSAALAPGASYTITARGMDDKGKQQTQTAEFSTAAPSKDKTFFGEYYPDKGVTVGVAHPVSVTFSKPVKNKAAVERALSVQAEPAVEGSWSWLKAWDGRDRIDYRPREYWKAHTKVTLTMHLAGVDAGGGVYGTQERVVDFSIGDAVTSTMDVNKKTLTLERNGKVVRTVPVSSGKPGFETWNGTMVVLSKVPTIRMNSESVGIFGSEAYDLGAVKWDVQLTTSGTYVHAAPWNEGKFGRVNGSHGCIGMSTSTAQWFYSQVKVGDPVTVLHSTDVVQPNNGYGDWNVDWDAWVKGSALS